MKQIEETIKLKVENYLKKNYIKNCKIIIAFSGGPDSTSLLHLLNDFKEYNLNLIAAYFNHGLRDTSELLQEEDIIRKICKKLSIKYEIGRSETGIIKKISKENGQSIEEVARIERYKFLEKIRNSEKADYIATAHNINDNTETMLMRFFSNSGINGLSGIPARREQIIRPLSYIHRDLIEDYLKEKKLCFSVDETNNETLFLRNKVRHLILPFVREIFPNVDTNLKALADSIREQNNFLDRLAEISFDWEKISNGWKIRKEVFFNSAAELRQRCLILKLNTVSKAGRINRKALFEAANNHSAESGKLLFQNADSVIHVSGDYIFVERLVNSNKKSYLLLLREGQKISINGCDFLLCRNKIEFESIFQHKIRFYARGNIILRSHREGDKIKTASGTKSLKRIFNEWSVKATDRDKIPVLEDLDHIVAVIGLPFGYGNKIIQINEDCMVKTVFTLNYNGVVK